MPEEIYQLGAVAVIFIFAIKEFFGWLRSKKNTKINNQVFNNHFGVINEKLDNQAEQGDRIEEKMNKIINLLTEIKTRLIK